MAKSHSSDPSASSSSKRKRSHDDPSSSSRKSSKHGKDRSHRSSSAASTSSAGSTSVDEADYSSGGESFTSASSMGSSSSSSSRHRSSSDKKSKKHRHRSNKQPSAVTSLPLSSGFELQYPVMTVAISPVHSQQPSLAVAELFDSLVMRFLPPLNGVLVSHGQTFFLVDGAIEMDESKLPPSALIEADGAFGKAKVAVECCVWRPKVGMKLEGRITLSTPSHVSLLIHSTFNASIPASHMDEYEFIEGEDEQDESKDLEILSSLQDGGYWRHKKTKERLGGSSSSADGGLVSFIVISLTISPPTLSVCGSLLARPFDVPPPSSTTLASTLSAAERYAFGGEFEEAGAGKPRSAEGLHSKAIKKSTRRVRWEEDEDDDDDDDDDPSPAKAGSGREVGPAPRGKHVTF